jgi:hypothetical protein
VKALAAGEDAQSGAVAVNTGAAMPLLDQALPETHATYPFLRKDHPP